MGSKSAHSKKSPGLVTPDGRQMAAIVTSPANMRSQSGFRGEGMVYVSEEMRLIFTDSRYTIAAKQECPDFEVIEYRGNCYKSLAECLKKRLGAERSAAMVYGYEDEYMTVREFLKLESVFKKNQIPAEALVPLHQRLDEMRQVKTREELEYISRAEHIGDLAFENILEQITQLHRAGKRVTEKQVAARLEFFMKEHGADGISFDTIAASGIHSSMPHAVPTDKALEKGDFLTLDFGCTVNGYCSDMTRTVVIGGADSRQREIYDVVLRAQMAALDGIRPGMTGCEVDELARSVIRDAGYGDCFGHSLGHSVGLQIHETPCFAPKSTDEICPGMVITVEPGIYVEGFGGVRIEDVVIITEDGCRNITHSPKQLIEICERKGRNE